MTAAGPRVRLVSATEGGAIVDDRPPQLVILDVRTPREFGQARIPGSVLLDVQDPAFPERLADLDRDVPYLVYCRSGGRSAHAAAMMADLGFADVTDVDGGIEAWHEAGLPLVAGQEA